MPAMKLTFDKKEFYRAHLARDPRFDGKFFVGVKTTMIYCRPICPARKAQLKNLEFFIHAAQAEEAGFRPCLRCRPETAPAWIGTSATVRRAMRMMDCFALEAHSIKDLAVKLGVGERWFRELFQQQVGASPQSILMAKKLDTARNLLDQSGLSITDIAFSSGFQSIRRFNDAFKKRFQMSPTAFRRAPVVKGKHRIELSFRPPYAWRNLIHFFSKRAISGVELVDNDCYQRLFTQGRVRGWFKAKLCDNNKIEFEFKLNENTNLLEFIAKLKNIFDLDADPIAIENCLKEDHQLKPFLQKFKGLRIPGGWDGFELAVRAIIGQRISVQAARVILGKIVECCGEKQTLDETLKLTRFFPTPENIIAADLSRIGLPVSRIETLQTLARKVMDKTLMLDGTADYEETCRTLLAIKGIGPWTVEYIAMRALRNPNGFPETDLEIQKKITQLQLHPQKWVLWRAYAAILLWNLQHSEIKT